MSSVSANGFYKGINDLYVKNNYIDTNECSIYNVNKDIFGTILRWRCQGWKMRKKPGKLIT